MASADDYKAKFIFSNLLVARSNTISTLLWTGDIAGTITVGAATQPLSSMPARHLYSTFKRERMRMASTDRVLIRLTFDSVISIGAAILLYHNLSANAQVRIKVWTDAAATTLIYDSGAVSVVKFVPWGLKPWGAFTWGEVDGNTQQASSNYFSETIGGQVIDFYVDDTLNTDYSYLEFGHIVLGIPENAERNFLWGRKTTHKNESVTKRTSDGSLISQRSIKYKDMTATFLLGDDNTASIINSIDALDREAFWMDVYPTHAPFNTEYQGMWAATNDISDEQLSLDHNRLSIDFTRN